MNQWARHPHPSCWSSSWTSVLWLSLVLGCSGGIPNDGMLCSNAHPYPVVPERVAALEDRVLAHDSLVLPRLTVRFLEEGGLVHRFMACSEQPDSWVSEGPIELELEDETRIAAELSYREHVGPVNQPFNQLQAQAGWWPPTETLEAIEARARTVEPAIGAVLEIRLEVDFQDRELEVDTAFEDPGNPDNPFRIKGTEHPDLHVRFELE